MRKLVNKIGDYVAYAVTPAEYAQLDKKLNVVYVVCGPGQPYDIVFQGKKIGTTDGKTITGCAAKEFKVETAKKLKEKAVIVNEFQEYSSVVDEFFKNLEI